MNATTGIEWTDATSNPFKFRDKATGQIVWACVKVSPGCAHCYSETLANRYGRGGPFTKAAMEKVEPFVCEKELRQLATSKKLAGKRVFVGDMTDLFGEWVSDDMLDRLFATFAVRPDVTFQVLTKRPERMRDYILGADGRELKADIPGVVLNREPFDWPLPNVWLGVSVENQAAADVRIPLLLQTPAAVRFLSCEPLLGPVDLGPGFRWGEPIPITKLESWGHRPDWVIVGGESGAGARPLDVAWARSVVNQCKAAGVACFVKQLGSEPGWDSQSGKAPGSFHHYDAKSGLHIKRLNDRKGGDPNEWPADLRVREFPAGART